MTNATDLKPLKWQAAVLQWLGEVGNRPNAQASSQLRKMNSPAAFNREFGLRLSWGRRMGHSTLAAMILKEYPDAVLIVPNDRLQEMMVRRIPEAKDRIIRATFPEGNDKKKIIKKEAAPLKGKNVCVIDNASLLTEWEISPFRCAPWDAYVELG